MNISSYLKGSSLVLLTVVAASSQAQFVNTVLSTNPVAYWRLSSLNDTDLVNGYTTSPVGSPTITAPGGGAPLASDPNNVGLNLPGSSYLTTSLSSQQTFANGGSVGAWINLAQLPSNAGRFFEVTAKSQVGNDFDLQVETDNKLKFYTNSGQSTVDQTALSINTWYYVSGTFDNLGNRSLYVDGNLVASDTNQGLHVAGGDTFSIGESLVFSGRTFNGQIDEVSLWDHALTAQEESAIYASAQAVPSPAGILALSAGIIALGLKRRNS